MKANTILISIIIVLLMVLSAITLPGHKNVTVDWVSSSDEGTVTVDYSISSSEYSKDINLAIIPIEMERYDDIYIYFDETPWISTAMRNGSSAAAVQGLYDHLVAELSNAGIDIKVTMVDEEGLQDLLAGPNATLIIANDLRNDTGLAEACWKWVNEGGILVAIGNHSIPFAFHNETEREEYGRNGIIVNYTNVWYDAGLFVNGTDISHALDLKYKSPYLAVSEEDVLANGGTVIGYVYDHDQTLVTSAILPFGYGKVLIFSGSMSSPFGINAEDVVADDLVKIIASNLLFIEGDVVYQELHLGKGSYDGTISIAREDVKYLFFSVATDDFNNWISAGSIE